MAFERDAYAVLQVDRRADAEVIHAAYRALARRFHPDGRTPDAARMADVNRAWERLRTPELRRRYDESGSGAGVAVGPGREPYDPWLAARQREAPPEPPSTIDFGRYAGWKITDVARLDPDYLRWLSRHSTGIRYIDAIARSLPNDSQIGRRGSLIR